MSLGDRPAHTQKGHTVKVNLNEIRARIVGRGRKAYTNPALASDLASLGSDEGYIWDEAQTPTDLSDAERVAHRAKWRGRAESVASSVGLRVSVGWLDGGEMLISHRAATTKAKARKA